MEQSISVRELKRRIKGAIKAVHEVRVLCNKLDPGTILGGDDYSTAADAEPRACTLSPEYEIPTPRPVGSKCWKIIRPPIVDVMKDPIEIAAAHLQMMTKVLDLTNPSTRLPFKRKAGRSQRVR